MMVGRRMALRVYVHVNLISATIKPLDDENQDSPSAPLKDTFRHLKLKYVELQEKFKKEIRKLEDQLEAEQTETGTKDRSIAALQAENTSLRDDITTLRGRSGPPRRWVTATRKFTAIAAFP